jgi:nucleotide-binding universal stress UspA family protein
MIEQESMERERQFLPPPATASFAKILVATDFSQSSDRALEHALSLARTCGSRIFLTHILPADIMAAPELAASRDEMRQAARAETGRIEGSGRFFGVRYEVIIEEGSLWPNLDKLINKLGIDLVVVGTHGKGALQKLLIGSSAEEVFRRADVPVLTVGPGVDREPLYCIELKNILFATEFGMAAERQAAYAFALAQEHCSRITLLHVEERDGDPEVIVRRLKRLLPSRTDLHCLPLFRIEKGEPVREILRTASETRADLIVLGAKFRRALAGNVPHSKAYRVVCGSSCPVLTIKS